MIQLHTDLTPPLNQFVDCMWYATGERSPYDREQLLPTGSVDLIIKLDASRSVRILGKALPSPSVGRAVMSGAYSRPYALDTSQPSATLGVHFRPGGAAPFFKTPISEFTNQHLSLEQLWGSEAELLLEQLMDLHCGRSLFSVMERSLLDHLTIPAPDALAVMHAIDQFQSAPSISVQSVCDSMGYRAKRFIRLFQESVGLTPKLFGRIQRFQSVLDEVIDCQQIDWADVAAGAGYYDQSHLIRDFRAFAGVTPGEYRPVSVERKNHMVLNS